MPQFTKGKWYAGMEDEYSPYVYAVNGKEDTIIAIIRSSTYSSDQFPDDEVIAIKKANARLIAKAPVMYDLPNQAFEALPDDHPLRYDIDACLCRVEGCPVPGEEDESTERNENSPLSLDEAIQSALCTAKFCGACAENHKQLAAWLTELKNLKEENPANTANVIQCKDCKHFERNSWANFNGIPLIVAHEICTFWGNGCKTNPEGYCFAGEISEEGDSSVESNSPE